MINITCFWPFGVILGPFGLFLVISHKTWVFAPNHFGQEALSFTVYVKGASPFDKEEENHNQSYFCKRRILLVCNQNNCSERDISIFYCMRSMGWNEHLKSLYRFELEANFLSRGSSASKTNFEKLHEKFLQLLCYVIYVGYDLPSKVAVLWCI